MKMEVTMPVKKFKTVPLDFLFVLSLFVFKKRYNLNPAWQCPYAWIVSGANDQWSRVCNQ